MLSFQSDSLDYVLDQVLNWLVLSLCMMYIVHVTFLFWLQETC